MVHTSNGQFSQKSNVCLNGLAQRLLQFVVQITSISQKDHNQAKAKDHPKYGKPVASLELEVPVVEFWEQLERKNFYETRHSGTHKSKAK